MINNNRLPLLTEIVTGDETTALLVPSRTPSSSDSLCSGNSRPAVVIPSQRPSGNNEITEPISDAKVILRSIIWISHDESENNRRIRSWYFFRMLKFENEWSGLPPIAPTTTAL